MKGFMLVLSAPAGAGKTTIANEFAKSSDFVKSISATTRAPRTGEVDGVDYFFMPKDKFDEMEKNGEFFESVSFNGNSYATVQNQIDEAINNGKIMLFTIEVDGMKKFKEKMSNDTVSIFILPPSLEELKKRVTLRGDDDHTITSRMEIAQTEINNFSLYDYTVVNDNLEKCIEEVKAIITAEKLKSHRRK